MVGRGSRGGGVGSGGGGVGKEGDGWIWKVEICTYKLGTPLCINVGNVWEN